MALTDNTKQIFYGVLFSIMVLLSAAVMLSIGIGRMFFDVPSWGIPMLMAVVFSSLLYTAVWLAFFSGIRWRAVGRYLLLYVAFTLLGLYLSNVGFMWYYRRSVLDANPFMPFWVAAFADAQQVPMLVSILIGLGLAYSFITVFIVLRWAENKRKNKYAHFQTKRELIKNKHTEAKGFPIGKLSKHSKQLLWDDPVAMTLLASTGSYKTSAIIVPTLLTFPGSSISTDTKSELWNKTKQHFKKEKVSVCRWLLFGDGTEESYTRINPFFYVPWQSEQADGFLRLITNTLVPLLKDYENTIWEQASRDAVMAVATHLYLQNNSANDVTLSKIVHYIGEPDLFCRLLEVYDLHNDDALYAQSFNHWIGKLVEVDDVKLKNNLVYSIQKDVANLFLPTVLRAMNANDIDLRDLRRRRMAIFVGIPLGRSDEVKIFLNLFYNLVMNLISEMGEPELQLDPYKILLNMEEFAETGKIRKLAQGANTYRSFGVRFIFVLQNIGQLESLYGKAETKTFISSGLLIKGGDNNHDDNVLFSERMGNKEVISYEGKGDTRRKVKNYEPLMSPDEIRQLSSDQWLILKEGEPPMKVFKLWDERDFNLA
jgi:type IV secretion system protein VirD4